MKIEAEMRRHMDVMSQEMEQRMLEMKKQWDVERHQLSEKVDQLSRDVNLLTPHIGTGLVSLRSLRRNPEKPDIQTIQCGCHALRVHFTFLSSLSSIALNLMFCPGPFDDTLPLFPFCGSVSILLRHPTDRMMDIEASLDTDEDDDFAALTSALSPDPDVHGWDEFCSYEDACDNVGADGLLRFEFIIRWKKMRSDYRSRKRKREF